MLAYVSQCTCTWLLLLTDQYRNSSSNPHMQDLEPHSEHLFAQDVPDFVGVDREKNKTQSAPRGIKERQFPSCESLDPHIGCLRSPISGNVTEDSISVSAELDDHIWSPKRKNLLEKGSSSSVRKMISAFENSPFQVFFFFFQFYCLCDVGCVRFVCMCSVCG